ncbi:uncharacterized protein L969DRAFT_95440 [Mixia osmundae IAM 14324]|uniref:Uncharacterized protein n=1 Tax=Mixia osmundae (strain CBS 9802 / IAM 14324 / JCM 22182 / KY 12970) TaxID=764103 RepID=G7E0I3_MIXOS|nr:uncharacterized protein L969DRAFT_95440 [Mixia osmundae IAM 14324]KEI38353.1 hypothetical protein L969DRAFT_95440 [Mixia osmundae IAM 14324]GAA96343.1 hypothetical protein E5Q_03009 [Mixia osmundae IAM 14324]
MAYRSTFLLLGLFLAIHICSSVADVPVQRYRYYTIRVPINEDQIILSNASVTPNARNATVFVSGGGTGGSAAGSGTAGSGSSTGATGAGGVGSADGYGSGTAAAGSTGSGQAATSNDAAAGSTGDAAGTSGSSELDSGLAAGQAGADLSLKHAVKDKQDIHYKVCTEGDFDVTSSHEDDTEFAANAWFNGGYGVSKEANGYGAVTAGKAAAATNNAAANNAYADGYGGTAAGTAGVAGTGAAGTAAGGSGSGSGTTGAASGASGGGAAARVKRALAGHAAKQPLHVY